MSNYNVMNAYNVRRVKIKSFIERIKLTYSYSQTNSDNKKTTTHNSIKYNEIKDKQV